MSNTINLMNNCFISADEAVSLEAITAPIAVRLMNATATKLADKQLKTVGNNAYYVSSITTSVGETQWVMIPVDHPQIKWVNNQAWALIKPQAETMNQQDWDAL